jgi:predicted TIM-barrel fold metal-dependent hydrolase
MKKHLTQIAQYPSEEPSMFDEFRAIDTDTHITEPPDVWTARVPKKWGDSVPHVRRVNGEDFWFVGDQIIQAPGWVTFAGFDGSYPDHPMGFDDIPASSFDAAKRLELMDDEGVYAQVLYPNVGGFGLGGFLKMKEPELMLACVRAYNDFLAEWCSADRNRLLGGAAIPFWDVSESVKEVHRAASLGHRTILACTAPQDFGQPRLAHPHWDPLWAAIEETGLPVSFHIGGGQMDSSVTDDASRMGTRANLSAESTKLFIGNAVCLTEILFGGICHRFPKLKLFSVESGAGWLPSYLETCDWQFVNGSVRKEHPDYLLPSEFFRRQVYASFWFESAHSVAHAVEAYPDNIMWETDFPHPTSQFPSLKDGWQRHPREYVNEKLSGLGEPVLRKVLHDNAARFLNLAN